MPDTDKPNTDKPDTDKPDTDEPAARQQGGPRLRRPTSFRAAYGGHPAHLLLLLAAAAVAGYGVYHWIDAPMPIRLLIWFAAAVVIHDAIAFPIYAGLDRLLVRVVGGQPVDHQLRHWRRAAVLHVRVPALLSLLLLIMWYPLILERSDPVYFAAAGQHQDRYLGNWLLAVAILFGASLVAYLLRLLIAGRAATQPAPAPRQKPTL